MFDAMLDKAEKVMEGLTGASGGHEIGIGDLMHVFASLYSMGKYMWEMDAAQTSRFRRLQKKNRLLMNHLFSVMVPDETMAAINEESKEGLD